MVNFSGNLSAKEYYQEQTKIAHYHSRHPNDHYLDVQRLTVKDLSFLHDGDYVILQGYIVKKLGNEAYLFRDSTGEIQLDLDRNYDYLLKGVNEKTMVEISGEYDRNALGIDEIEVKNLRIMQ